MYTFCCDKQKSPLKKGENIIEHIKHIFNNVNSNAEIATKVVDVDKEMTSIEKSVPGDAYKAKISAIDNASIPLEDKIALFDDADQKRMALLSESAKVQSDVRKNKLKCFLIAVGGFIFAMLLLCLGFFLFHLGISNKWYKGDK